jgi:hypothetical protein
MGRTCAVVAGAALLVVACGNDGNDVARNATGEEGVVSPVDDTTTTTEAETTTTEAETTTTTIERETTTTEAQTTTTTEAPEPRGTRGDPVPVGTSGTVGDWEVTFAPTNTDATQEIMAANQFNDPPGEGRVFIMAEVTVTYTGNDSGTPWLDLAFDFVDSAGNTSGTGEEDYCGVIPNDLFDVGEMFPDASGSGNVCAVVASDQVDGGVWIVEDFFTFDGSRVFFGLEQP